MRNKWLAVSLGILFSTFANAAEKVVAVADISFGNPTSKLVFKPEGVRDVITQSLYQQTDAKVIDWSRLSAVLFRRNLEWSDVADDDKAIGELQEVLLNDYFLVGTVSNYSERVDYDGGAFSKKKTQIVDIQIDLFLKDAITNEVVAAARGIAQQQQQIKQNLGFGAGANANLGLSSKVLNIAVDKAVLDLAQQVELQKHKGDKS